MYTANRYQQFKHQNGVALIIAMIVLVILTILGVTAMNTSNLELKMSSNAKQQASAFQNAENARVTAEQAIQAASGAGFTTTPTFPASWTAAIFRDLTVAGNLPIVGDSRSFWSTVGTANSRNFIEYLGIQNLQDDGGNLADFVVFRINAFGIDSANTDVILRVIYVCQVGIAGC